MVRGTSIVLGIGLVILWLVGLNQHATAWLTWLDGLAALCAFGVAGALPENAAGASMIGGPIGISIGLFVLWIIGLVEHSEAWLTSWTFGFALAFLLLAPMAGSVGVRPTVRRTV